MLSAVVVVAAADVVVNAMAAVYGRCTSPSSVKRGSGIA